MTTAPVAGPVRLMLSEPARASLGSRLAQAAGGTPLTIVGPGADADVAFVSRDVTGLSTKHEVRPETQRFYDALSGAPSMRWVHAHSAGADRPVYLELRRRGVMVTTSSGTNASIVAQTALAGILSLAREFPRLGAAQRESRWAPLIGSGAPRDLDGQTAMIVGWGPIGQRLGVLLAALGLRLVVARATDASASPDIPTLAFERIGERLPGVDWLVLACPLSDRTRGLVDARAIHRLPRGARIVNVARGEVIDEPALVEALRAGRLAGAFLDVFDREPLPADSPLWHLPNVIVTPHSAGHSDGNERRVADLFVSNFRLWLQGAPLVNVVG